MISEVHNIDCLELMRTLPDKCFQLAIADPPYGINAPKMGMGSGYSDGHYTPTKRLNGGAGKLKNRVLNQSDCEWDSKPPTKDFFDELFRVCENVIIWGGNYFNLPPTRCVICWDKVQPWENFSQIELAWTSFDKPAKLYRQINGGANSERKIHPTQKPIELYAYLLDTFAKPGDRIFDPMMGSQSSRIAAYKLGFDYVGCELDKEYFAKGCERFDRECHGITVNENGQRYQQTSIFD
jgi:site-specific DNA-methyltransferase (adenine-specific)